MKTLRVAHLGSFNLVLPFPVTARLLAGFHCDMALLVFRVITDIGEKDEKCHVKMPQNVLFLLRFSSAINVLKFFLNKCFLDCCKPLVNFEF